jgi:deferrochelatase/peroxidase EfeB
VTEGFRSEDRKIMGGLFVDGINNPVEPAYVSHYIISNGPQEERGGCFALTQKFLFNWEQIQNMSQYQKENMIGRKSNGTAVLQSNNSHVVSSRIDGPYGVDNQVIRQQ